ncbi:MAG: hypothetical protein IKE24_12005 [Clostridia bacterium]|nr:hypothetical protein [Clostridia bacterium]
MCYLVCKDRKSEGCFAIKTEFGPDLAKWKQDLYKKYKSDGVQLVTISRPSAYGEYAPYQIVSSKQEFEKQCQALHVNFVLNSVKSR